MAWYDGSPIMSRLPKAGYKDNEAAQALVGWIDSKMSDKAEQLQQYYKQLDPETADEQSLDFLAYLCGLSGNFWDTTWAEDTKRTLIKNSHIRLWSQRGSLETIQFVLNAHKIAHSIWMGAPLLLPFSFSKPFGSNKLNFYVRLPLNYNRTGKQFKETERTLKNFAPAVVKHRAVYAYFYLGTSQLGDPMFSKPRTL